MSERSAVSERSIRGRGVDDPDGSAIVVRPLRSAHAGGEVDDDHVRRLFAETLLLGRPAPSIECFDGYTSLCLGWYLGPGRGDARLAIDAATGAVVGYALVCTDEHAYRRWVNAHALAFASSTLVQLVFFGLNRPSRDFYRARAADARDLRRSRHESPMPVHAHMNVQTGHRSGRVATALRDHIDDRCRANDVEGWWAEMNARRGRRAVALERLGLEIVARVDNRTLSSALGDAVERLTVVRRVRPAAAAAASASRARRSAPPPHRTVRSPW